MAHIGGSVAGHKGHWGAASRKFGYSVTCDTTLPRLTFVGVVVPPEAKEEPAVFKHVIVAHVMHHLLHKGPVVRSEGGVACKVRWRYFGAVLLLFLEL